MTPALLALGLCVATACAAPTAAPPKPQAMGGMRTGDEPAAPATPLAPWRIDDLIGWPEVVEAELAPDGLAIAYTRRTLDAAKDRYVTRLWLADLPMQQERPLTRGPFEESAPRWNEDGKALAFVSTRPQEDDAASAKPQVFVLRMDGGEPFSVTSFPEGVAGVQWASKRRLIVAARERPSRAELARADTKDRSIDVESDAAFRDGSTKLFLVTLGMEDAATVRRIGPASPGSVAQFAVAPDGDAVVAHVEQSPRQEVDGREPPRVVLLDVASGREQELFAARKSKPERVLFSAEGQLLYAAGNAPTVDGENHAGVTLAWEIDRATLAERPIELGSERGLAGTELVVVNDGFVAPLADGVDPKFHRFTRAADGRWSKAPLVGEQVDGLERLLARPGIDTAASFRSRATDPGGWRLGGLVDSELRDERALPLVPSRAAGRRLAPVEAFRFAGANGAEVEALLWHPSDPQRAPRDGRWPLIVAPHGGPYANDVDRFRDRWGYAWHLLAERGAFVLAVNYHGSAGYGRAFAESIKGRYYEQELLDLVRAIEHVAARHPVDRERLACIGWSNGAILSIALTSLLQDFVPDARLSFRACVAGAGDVNWTSDYGNCRFGPAFDDYYLGGPPWRESAAYLAKSPLFHAERVTTPTLVLFGDEDTHVPTAQGWEWYRALQQIGKAPVKFVLFPDEPHGLTRPSSRRRKLEEELAFLDRHLFEEAATAKETVAAAPATEHDPVKEGSPLWSALQAESFARVGDAWGEPLAAPQPNWPVKGRAGALPEVVDVDGLLLGRFEVTRAQWQTFRPELVVAPGDENLPIADVALADAQAYVEWLSMTTGAAWRLPYLDELEPLAAVAAALPGENTLDHSAGYAPRPEDAAALLARAERDLFARVAGLSPLIRDVGLGPPLVRGPPSARVALYDLGGNVAEWALARGEDSTKGARAVGGCALVASDPGSSRGEVLARGTGLRVVRKQE